MDAYFILNINTSRYLHDYRQWGKMWTQRCYFAGQEERLTLVQKVTFYYSYLNTGSPQFVAVCFAMIHKNNGFETRRSKISKSY
jgi:hypothetical protein